MILSSYHKLQKSILVLLCYLSLPISAFAGTSVVDSVLSDTSSFMIGPWGKALCTLVITSVGYVCFVLGKLPVSCAISVAVGAACAMGVSELLTEMGVATQS